MSTLLGEAIRQLNLQPGQTFRTNVEGRDVEVRVLDPVPKPEPPAEKAEPEEEESEYADAIMLNVFVDIPPSPNARTMIAQRDTSWPLPDPPVIPEDDEEAP